MNARLPMLATLAGIVTLVSPEQPENVEFPMLVTGFPLMNAGMSTAPTGFETTPVIVTAVPLSVYKKLPDVPDVSAETEPAAKANPSQIAKRHNDNA